jgi:hypothetical protein
MHEETTTMEQRMSTDPERELEHGGDELEERIGRLGDHIDEAKQSAAARREDPDPFEEAAGDWEDTDENDRSHPPREDAEGFDDPEVDDADEDDDL